MGLFPRLASHYNEKIEREMARAPASETQIADESIQELRVDAANVKCKICFETFFHPLMLPCQHTFCASCVINSCPKRFVRTVKCALCREIHQLPNSSIKNLKVNRLILELLDENGKSGRVYSSRELASKLKKAGQYCRDQVQVHTRGRQRGLFRQAESDEESSSEYDSSDFLKLTVLLMLFCFVLFCFIGFVFSFSNTMSINWPVFCALFIFAFCLYFVFFIIYYSVLFVDSCSSVTFIF